MILSCFLLCVGLVAGQGADAACDPGQGAEACDVSLLQVHLEKEQVQLHTSVEYEKGLPLTPPGLSSDQKDAMLSIHNKLRSEQHSNQPCPAADMEELVWDEGLAALAQAKAETCRADATADVGTTFGENIYKSGCGGPNISTDKVTGAVQDWYDEHRSTEWKRNTVVAKRYAPCGSNVAHFYQLVWAETKKVGCGAASCPNIEFEGNHWGAMYMVVCRYDVPAKQTDGMTQGLPFIPGRACAACPDSCSAGLCTSTPERCKGDDCKGKDGIGYEACGAEPPPEFNSNPPSIFDAHLCKLPLLPLNAEFVCETADGSRSLPAEDLGFFLWGVKEDPDITCHVRCKQFSRGPFGTGEAIRFTQPQDRIAVSQVCDKEGKQLNWTQSGPQWLIDNDIFLLNFCMPIPECELPELEDERARYDPNSCTISPDVPRDTAHRYREGEHCNVLCEEGYELDFRFSQRANTCTYPKYPDKDKKILGTRGPPMFAGGEYPGMQPKCIKKAGKNWLTESAKTTCQGHLGMENTNFGGGYTIHDDDKKDDGCPLICLVRTGDYYQNTIIDLGTQAKSRMGNLCDEHSPSDARYTQTTLNYCCCAKTACFKEDGSLKDAPASTDMGDCSDMHYRPLCDANKACKWDWMDKKCGWDCRALPKDKCTKDMGCSWTSWSNSCGTDYGW